MSKLVYVDRHVIEYLMHVLIGCGALMVCLSSVGYSMCNKMKITNVVCKCYIGGVMSKTIHMY